MYATMVEIFKKHRVWGSDLVMTLRLIVITVPAEATGSIPCTHSASHKKPVTLLQANQDTHKNLT